MLGIKITKVIASIPSYFADFSMIKGSIKITSDDHVITGDDVIEVLKEAMKTKMSANKEMVTMMPIDFTIDDKTGIKDPKGLVGGTLGVRAILATTPKNIYSVVSLLYSLGIETIDISLNSIGDIYAFKTKELENKVGAIINIGSEGTSVSLYNKGIIVKNSIIQLGGKNIDNDIAYMYKVDLKTAKTIKEKFALAHKMYASVNDVYEIETAYEEKIKINQFEVSEIAMSRIEEILNLAKKEINLLTNKQIEYIIITGGTSNMAHFGYVAEDIFGKNVSIGNVKMIGIRNNKYSSAIGNVVYFINKLKLKGRDYTMLSDEDIENLSSPKRGLVNVSGSSMLGKVFGYFFGENEED